MSTNTTSRALLGVSDGHYHAVLFDTDASGRPQAIMSVDATDIERTVRQQASDGVFGLVEIFEGNTIHADLVPLQPGTDAYWESLARGLHRLGWHTAVLAEPWAELWWHLQVMPLGSEFHDMSPSVLRSVPEAEVIALVEDARTAQRELEEIAVATSKNDGAEARAIRHRALELAGLVGGATPLAV